MFAGWAYTPPSGNRTRKSVNIGDHVVRQSEFHARPKTSMSVVVLFKPQIARTHCFLAIQIASQIRQCTYIQHVLLVDDLQASDQQH